MGGESRHSRAFQFRSSSIRPLFKDGLKSWEITSNLNKYTIEEIIQKNVHKCSRKCRTCKVCFHMYTCTCPDYAKGNTICKHIHACILNMDNKLDTAAHYYPQQPYVNYSHHYDVDEDDDDDEDEEDYESHHHGMFSMNTISATATAVRHDRGLKINPLTIYATHTEASLESWNVTSTQDISTVYAVREVAHVCEECESKCSSCNACEHMFTCTCPDYDNGFMCKHIHACIIFFKIGSQCENISSAEKTTETDKNAELIELLNNCKWWFSKTIYKKDDVLKLKKGLQKILKIAAQPDCSQPVDSKKNTIPINSIENLQPAVFEGNSIPGGGFNRMSNLKREMVPYFDYGVSDPKELKRENEIYTDELNISLPCMIVKTESMN